MSTYQCNFWMCRLKVCVFLMFFGLALPIVGYGIDFERESLALLYEPEQAISAMRSLEPAVESPAIMSIFTQEQIRTLGARTIPELLEFVPGFTPWRSVAGDWWPGPRGIFDSNRSFLVMIDGVSINNQYLGTPYWIYDIIDISRFRRIEIIRGPGSALYGANAFLAVINCVTETRPADGGALRTMVGTYNTRGIGLSKVFRSGRTIFDLSLAGLTSDGQSRHIESDIYGKSGNTRDGFSKKDFMLKIDNQRGLTFLAHHVEGGREGYIGYFENLNDKTFYRRINDLLSLRYQRDLANEANFSVGVFYNGFSDSEVAETVSPGNIFNKVFYPLGVMEEDHSRDLSMGINFLWKGPKAGKHQVSVGGEATSIRLLESSVLASYANPADPRQLTPIANKIPRPERFSNNSLTLQDDIRLNSKMRLVLGARYDKHSLFGDSVSPRAGFIYRLNNQWTGKLLFGKAYRNPDFHEIVNNRNLKPELINTNEFQLLGELGNGWLAKINLFNNHIRDRIESSRLFFAYKNVSEVVIDGMELEIKRRFAVGQEIFGNFSAFRLRSETQTPEFTPSVPSNQLNLGYSFKAGSYDTCIWGSFTSHQPRNAFDGRQPVSQVGLVHLTVQKQGFPGVADRVILRVRNLLNSYQTFVPAPNPEGILNYYPQPGREVSVEMSWNL